MNARAMFAATIEEMINNSPKTQLEIAEHLGYPNGNIELPPISTGQLA